ncbi:MAG: divalent-cation tolerance protein CutA [Candidatus Methylomirabilales bacterium]
MPAAAPAIVVLITCPSAAVGEKIGQALVEARLAACVNVVPRITSIYRWEGKVVRDREVLLLVKTRPARFAALRRHVVALHPYSVPEIIALPLRAGLPAYLDWIAQATR